MAFGSKLLEESDVDGAIAAKQESAEVSPATSKQISHAILILSKALD